VIAYTMVGTRDLGRALEFYRPLFAQMGLEVCWEDKTSASFGRRNDVSVARFFVGYPFDGAEASVGNGVMTAFHVSSPDAIDSLYELALAKGGSDEGAPGYRPQYAEDFYAAYVRDLDGNKLAFVRYPEISA